MLKLGSPNSHLGHIFYFNFTFCSHNMKAKKIRPRNYTPACDKCLESKHPPLNGPFSPNWWRTFRHCFVPSFALKIQWSESSSLCPPHASFKRPPNLGPFNGCWWTREPVNAASVQAILQQSLDECGHWPTTLPLAEKGQCSSNQDRPDIVLVWSYGQHCPLRNRQILPESIHSAIWATKKDKRSIDPTSWVSVPPNLENTLLQLCLFPIACSVTSGPSLSYISLRIQMLCQFW